MVGVLPMALWKTLKSIRNDESFDLLWEKVLTHAKRLDMNEPTLPRKSSQPRSMQNYFGYGNGKEAVQTCPKNFYRKHYFEAFDTMINWIESRFDQEDFKMYALLEQVLLKAAKHDEYEEELKEIIQFYKEDELLLRIQLLTFLLIFNQPPKRTPVSPCQRFVHTCKICPLTRSRYCRRSYAWLNWCWLPLLQTLPMSDHSAQCEERNRTWKARWDNNG